MPDSVVITGIGVISALGLNAGDNFSALVNGRHGIAPVNFLQTIHKDMPVGEVRYFNPELTDMLDLNESRYLTRTALLALHAGSEAYRQAEIPSSHKLRIGLISATSVGGMDRSENFYAEFLSDPRKGHLRDIISHDCGESTERMARYLNIRDYVATISTACSSSANAIMLGTRLIKNNHLDAVLAGGTDALTRFTLNGFNTLMILDKNHCRPFDDTRSGLNLGEGAGFIFMESEKSAIARKARILAVVSGYGNANDAYHQTASSPEGFGAALAMNKAFKTAGLLPHQIDYINVHGTGTPNNDLSEGTAIQNIYGNDIPPFSSTKSFTGHTLGAAGGIEAVFSVLSLQNNCIFPNLNYKTRMKELTMVPVTTCSFDANLKHILSNSFGFGGNNSSLIFSKA